MYTSYNQNIELLEFTEEKELYIKKTLLRPTLINLLPLR